MRTTIAPAPTEINATLPKAELYLSAEFLGQFVALGNSVKVMDEGSLKAPIGDAIIHSVEVAATESQHGTYYVRELKNTKVISFVDSDGRVYLAPFSNSRLNGLIEAGFKNSFISFPVFEGEFPGRIQGEVRSQYLLLEAATKIENYNDNRRQFQNLLQSKAQEMDLKPLVGINRDWFCVDGVSYMEPPFENGSTPPKYPGDILSEDGNPRHSLMESIGFYGINNGMLSFVNEEGRQFVAPWTEARENVLRLHGYLNKGVVVPFSNGQLPYDLQERQLFKELMAGHTIEQRGW